MKLKEGIYENLITEELSEEIHEAENNDLVCQKIDIDDAESPKLMSDYLASLIKRRMDDESLSVEARAQMVNEIVKSLRFEDKDVLRDNTKMLSQVMTRATMAVQNITNNEQLRPKSGFRVSNLFTGGNSALSLESEILKDIASADRISIIVSFLRMSGLRLILPELKRFCETDGHSLRVITTTYCGITEPKAVSQLSGLPNTEIRISYNTDIERLHAKSYIFERNSGLSTAYIGSSNLSKSAQTDGLEWNIRVTNVENPHIIKSALATFDMYWDNSSFEDFQKGGIDKLNEELKKQFKPSGSLNEILNTFFVQPHQKVILDKLMAIRNQGVNRNLVVAATGTGKTVISAFDYKYYKDHHRRARLLFIAHREEILKQSRYTYCSVLQDANFGELWVGNFTPSNNLDYLFLSVQTANSQFETLKNLGPDYYDYVVIDEAHHMAADSYQKIVDFFTPDILLGLTATPERMDGKSLLPDFCNCISAEIRLAKALEDRLLTPFHYFCVSDNTDLSDDDLWVGNKYVNSKLSERLRTKERVALVCNSLNRYLADEQECKALCFCVDKEHAEFMAKSLREQGLKAESLTSDTTRERRVELNKAIREGKVNYLCVVDIFNEGVDIPEIDTVLFLRPTESLTVFLQQFGRGLRLCPGKTTLTVLDFVAQVNRNYDFVSRFRALLTRTDVNVAEQITNGFSFLPYGCVIKMEEKAQKQILENIHSAIYGILRLVRELSGWSKVPTISEFLESNGQDIRLLYRGSGNCWTSLKRAAGKCTYADDEWTRHYSSGMGSFYYVNSAKYLAFLKRYLDNGCKCRSICDDEKPFLVMLYYALYQKKLSDIGFASLEVAVEHLAKYPLFVQELREIIDYLLTHVDMPTIPLSGTCEEARGLPAGLEQYGCYSREEVFALFGRQTANKKMQGSASGVFKIDNHTELFFVTLNKSDKDFSASTQYDDYLISENRFHWQSQNTDSHAGRGNRFVEQKENNKKFILFVREYKKDGFGNTCPFYCFGLVDYLRSNGDFPMNIEWQLKQPAMPQFLKAV